MDLGRLLARSGSPQEVLPVLTRAVEVLEHSLRSNHVSVAEALRLEGRVLQDLGRLEAARGRFERGLAIVEEADFECLRGDPRFTTIVRQVEGRRGPA